MAKHSALSKERQGKPRGETPGLDEVHSQQNARTAVARPTPPEPAPDLDRLIHERMRLGIVSALAVNQSMSFRDLKKLLNTTDGNL
ncbi:MAG TPA: hypothetical protein VJX67_21970, partial [Blastocatellia bacterium]|nr:hypothetical protein [Blastocatellia bacterium]